MKVAIAQISPALGESRRNLTLHLDRAARARRAGADLVVFPELSLTGYLLLDLAHDLALDVRKSPEARRLAAASAKIAILAGLVEETPELRFHNTAVLFESGKLVHRHRKVYLPTYGMFDEGRYFAPGDRFRVHVSPRLGRIGVLVCEDAWHPSSAYVLAQAGVDLICIISAGPVRGVETAEGAASRTVWRDLCRAIAQFNTVHVIYCNRVGNEDGWTYSGGSLAVDPLGEVIAESSCDGEDLLLVDVRPERLREARIRLPLLRDEKTHLVQREIARVLRRRAADAGDSPSDEA